MSFKSNLTFELICSFPNLDDPVFIELVDSRQDDCAVSFFVAVVVNAYF